MRQPLNETAYERLKDLIITLELKPGEHLNVGMLEQRLKIGRTPVVHAINRLVFDGLVDVMPRKGVIVRPLSLNEVLDIIDVRTLNEVHCARLAAVRADESDLLDMERILDLAEQASRDGDFQQQMLAGRDFHLALSRASGNAVLGELLRGLHQRSLRFWFIALRAPGHEAAVHNEHRELVAALRAKDPDAAETAITRHIESFKRTISRHI